MASHVVMEVKARTSPLWICHILDSMTVSVSITNSDPRQAK